jgi:hypothetical protein
MSCNKCGSKLHEASEFCHKCGSKMVSTGDVAQSGNEAATLPTASATPKRTPLGWFTGSRFGMVPVCAIGLMLGIWIGGTGGTIILWTVVAIQFLKVGLCIKAFKQQSEHKITIWGIVQDIILALILLLFAVSLPGMFEEAGHGQQQGQTQQTTTGQQQPVGTIGNRIVIGETRHYDDGSSTIDVTLEYVEFVDSFVHTWGDFATVRNPEDGHVFLSAVLTIRNTGTRAGRLLTTWTNAVYDNSFEFSGIVTDGNFDLNPLTDPETVAVGIMVPIRVAESDGSLVLNFDGMMGENFVSFVIRPSAGIPESAQSRAPIAPPQATDGDDWINLGVISIPPTWSYDDWNIFEIMGEGVGGTIQMNIYWKSDEDIELLDVSALDGFQWIFNDGNSGWELQFNDSIVWVNGNRALFLWHFGDYDLIGNNWETIDRIARTLTRNP